MTTRHSRTSERPRGTGRPPHTVPQSIELMYDLLDEGLMGGGLTYAIRTEADGEEVYRTNTDAHRVSVMLFAAEHNLRIDRFGDVYLHYGRRMPPYRTTITAVRRLVRALRNLQDVQFALLWHVGGESRVHLDYSTGISAEDVERLEYLAREELLGVVAAGAR